MELNEDFMHGLLVPLKVVWLRTRHEDLPIPWNKMTNQQLVELCIDFDRMKTYGFQSEARNIHRAVDIHGYNTVRDFLAQRLSIE